MMVLLHRHIYAFSDSLNDIEMLEYVNKGIAMRNAPKAAKSVTDYVTDNITRSRTVKD